jgi:hypothetical protein
MPIPMGSLAMTRNCIDLLARDRTLVVFLLALDWLRKHGLFVARIDKYRPPAKDRLLSYSS